MCQILQRHKKRRFWRKTVKNTKSGRLSDIARTALEAEIKRAGHDKPVPDFVPVRKYSYLKKLGEHIDSKNGKRMMDVQCVCGTEFALPYRMANQGYKISCGCRDEDLNLALEHHKLFNPKVPRRMVDLRTAGENGDGVFGMLKAVAFNRVDEKIIWQLDCACGKSLNIPRRQLTIRKVMHCGSQQCASLLGQRYTRDQAIMMFEAARRKHPLSVLKV